MDVAINTREELQEESEWGGERIHGIWQLEIQFSGYTNRGNRPRHILIQSWAFENANLEC